MSRSTRHLVRKTPDLTSPGSPRQGRGGLPADDQVLAVVLRCLGAGTAGTLAEAILTKVQDRVRGGLAVFDPGVMAGKLAETWLHRRPPAGWQRLLGTAMRCAYGPGWGMLFGLSRATLRGLNPGRAWPLHGLLLGGALIAFEMTALPLNACHAATRRLGPPANP